MGLARRSCRGIPVGFFFFLLGKREPLGVHTSMHIHKNAPHVGASLSVQTSTCVHMCKYMPMYGSIRSMHSYVYVPMYLRVYI